MSAKHADVVFPASSFAEKDGTFTNTERRVSRVREAAPLPGDAKGDREIVILMAKSLGANWPEYPDAESVWNELADLAPAWYGLRYDRIEENGMQWPVPEMGHPGTRSSTRLRPRAPPGAGQVLSRGVPAPDRGARLRVPARPLDRPHALPLQLGDDDHARVGDHRQAGGAVLRDHLRGRAGARPRRRRLGTARLAPRRAPGQDADLRPRLPRPRLDGPALRRAEGQLADARRGRPTHRDAGVQDLGCSRRAR